MGDTYIIAEVGSNWSGFEDAIVSVGHAAACGADAVKFQYFKGSDLYFDGTDEEIGVKRDWLPQLKEKADACGIDFLCSVFSPEGVEVVDPFVSRHKIAASEAAWPQLLEAVNRTGKKVIITVGALADHEIRAIIKLWGGGDADPRRICILYGEPEYPSRGHNLFALERLARYGVDVGLSDHSLDYIYAPLSAVVHFNAVVIEKHVQFVAGKYPDSCASISGEEFAAMCRAIREYPSRVHGGDQREYRLKYRRRLIACEDIAPGERFQYGVNYGAFRSAVSDTKALPPYACKRLDACTSRRDIRAGQAIGPEDVTG